MKILGIRFKNLNSLRGEWKIDLTHPSFSTDGIFAITGPTGAGKTTILDAVCLALYGRTPRLDKISNTTNELMSRRTAECFAEVTFQTQTGTYRCHWSQRRARGVVTGTLQAPAHEVTHVNENHVYKDGLRAALNRIEALTGLNFQRFTRSMLLAQGDFAAFLKAETGERSEILEQITGTDIYSQISAAVFERQRVEKEKLTFISVQLDALQLLSSEQEEELKKKVKSLEEQATVLEKTVMEKKNALAWLETLAKLEKELEALAQKEDELNKRQEKFKPQLLQLERAKKALEIDALYSELSSLRIAQVKDKTMWETLNSQIPPLTGAITKAEKELCAAEENKSAEKKAQEKGLELLKEVYALDATLQEKKVPVETAKKDKEELQKKLIALRETFLKESKALEQTRGQLMTAKKYLAEHMADAGLVEQLSGMEKQFETLCQNEKEIDSLKKQTGTAQERKETTVNNARVQQELLKKQKEELKAIETRFTDIQAQINKVLEDQELHCWRKTLTTATEKKGILEQLVGVRDRVRSLTEENKTRTSQLEELATEKTILEKNLLEQQNKTSPLEKEIDLLGRNLDLIKQIQGLEEKRHQLEDGKPCPLCGATEHPYAQGNVPTSSDTEKQLKEKKKEHQKTQEVLSQMIARSETLLKELKDKNEERKKLLERLAKEEKEQAKFLSQLGVTLPSQEPDAAVTALITENDERYVKASTIVAVADDFEKKLLAERAKKEQAAKKQAEIELKLQETLHEKESAEKDLTRLSGETKKLEDTLAHSRNQLLATTTPFGITALSHEQLATLRMRREEWVRCNDQKQKWEQQAIQLKEKTEGQAAQIRENEESLYIKQTALEVLVKEEAELIQKRHTLFGEKKAEEEKERLSKLVQKAEETAEKTRMAVAHATQARDTAKTKTQDLEKVLQERQKQLEEKDSVFGVRLKEKGFVDEPAYKAARMEENVRIQREKEAGQLENERTTLSAQKQERLALKEKEQQKELTIQPREALEEEWEKLTEEVQKSREAKGAAQNEWAENEKKKHQQLGQRTAFDKQNEECRRWTQLQGIIGSSDGKKYRNFAQGLTFEKMVGYANRQLQKMTDRYLLVRDQNAPLELQVIDNYHAGEVRSTKNLSGGESFIVSLSLALGLSQMASKNVRVDSLFLDEGFGTLDDEALETALNTLASLRQDGKLIGIISHVLSLKERIPTQIQVSLARGGRSVLAGPGCEQIEA